VPPVLPCGYTSESEKSSFRDLTLHRVYVVAIGCHCLFIAAVCVHISTGASAPGKQVDRCCYNKFLAGKRVLMLAASVLEVSRQSGRRSLWFKFAYVLRYICLGYLIM